MIYRVMVPEDYPGLYEMWMSCHGMGLNNVDDTAEGIERYLRRNPHTSFVCEHEGKIIGAIMAGHDGRRGYIHHTAVAETYRHHGIGHQLVEHALEALLKEG
ncbi:MAG: GNAT family N-acetyltransferase, partial [Erysipelotrichaceae bacterium]|nr:GNAT family N-acetyltransferase [Erysipelotrichaceae bacterium]